MPRYINPYTDFGFKRLFGSTANKSLLIDFLNCLVLPEHTIADLEFRSTEHLPATAFERKAFFDLRCLSKSGEHFIVEMQKAKFHHFKDRALFYATFPIKDQAVVGEWDFRLQPVYFVAILDFLYDEDEERAKLLREVQLRDQNGERFSEKLHFRFIQMPAFKKNASELATQFDKWCYFLKNLESFEVLPEILHEPVFVQGIETLREGALTKDELPGYEQSMKDYLDLTVYIREQKNDAMAEGEAKGKAEGLVEGEAKGKAEGLAEGEAKGKAEGLAEGEAKGMINLILESVSDGDLSPLRAQEKLRTLQAHGRITADQYAQACSRFQIEAL